MEFNQQILAAIVNELGREDLILSRAPGRINLIGEHTDYNQGLVFPAAINKYFYFGIKPNGSSYVNAKALDLNEVCSIDLNDMSKTGMLWADYLVGVLLQFKQRGVALKGFDCALSSEVPVGSGMSSSAALDCGFIVGLNKLYDANLDNWEIVQLSSASNNQFLGIKSGILDQFASVFGKPDHAMMMNCANHKFEYAPIDQSEYSWLLINTCVKHSHLTSGYNDRVDECLRGLESLKVKFPDISSISDIKNVNDLDDVHFENQRIRDRVSYIIEENTRVITFEKALKESDVDACGQLLYQSHDGLSNKYEVSCNELDFLVALFEDDPSVKGSRMMGGGFGGCTINLVKTKEISMVQEKAKEAYLEKFGIQPEFYALKISDGAGLVFDE